MHPAGIGQTQRIKFSVMAGPGELQLLTANALLAANVAEGLIKEAQRLEQKYSRFLPDSVTSKINKAAGNEKIFIDSETSALLDVAQQAFDLSDGLFDITSGSLRKLWNKDRVCTPSDSEIAEALKAIGWHLVERDKSSIRLPQRGMQIDFGGVVKEYAVDRLCTQLQASGIEAGLVNLAGDVRAFGSTWQIGIRDPHGARDTIHSKVEVSNGAIATSGDYERFIRIEDVNYSHLVNPKTGWPIKSFASVSVCAPTCSLAGILSTSAMLMGPESGLSLLKQSGFEFLIIENR